MPHPFSPKEPLNESGALKTAVSPYLSAELSTQKAIDQRILRLPALPVDPPDIEGDSILRIEASPDQSSELLRRPLPDQDRPRLPLKARKRAAPPLIGMDEMPKPRLKGVVIEISRTVPASRALRLQDGERVISPEKVHNAGDPRRIIWPVRLEAPRKKRLLFPASRKS